MVLCRYIFERAVRNPAQRGQFQHLFTATVVQARASDLGRLLY